MHVTVNRVKLFFDVEGAKLVPDGPSLSEKPTLILLHGGPGFDHSSFKPYFSRFADCAQVIYLDHRGQGRSDCGSPQEWTLNQWADDVAVFCEVLGIEKPIVLGHSFGGMVAMAYATRHPEHPDRLILSSTSARHAPARVLARFENVGGPVVREAARRFWQDPTPATWAEYIEVVLPCYGQHPWSAEAFQRIQFQPEILFHFAKDEFRRFDLLPDLHRVHCPTLVLGGSLDPICPIEDQEDIIKALPNGLARFERFDQCGHGVFRDDPAGAERVIRGFIESPASIS
jgi:pimeloyl-ACP methyl ester carboxylesterase